MSPLEGTSRALTRLLFTYLIRLQSTEMNHINVLTALHRASLLVAAEKKSAVRRAGHLAFC
jgi:hypothetical protein